jgi:hypothetical protein
MPAAQADRRQQALIDSQRVQIAAQGTVADSQTARIAAQDTLLAALRPAHGHEEAARGTESQANFPAWEDSLEKRIKQVEAASQKSPELPPDIVSAGDFPGSIRIPGSDAAIKFGGRVRTAAVLTLDPLGPDDRFLTNSIPVANVCIFKNHDEYKTIGQPPECRMPDPGR